MTAPAFCTILARNYLPKALALSDSLIRNGHDTPLTVFLIDARPETELPAVPGVRWMRPASLELPERTVLELAMSYNLVEFATAVKPLVLQALLQEHEQVAYLDPDTYVTSPMLEIGPALDAGSGIVLTPHYLEPTPAGGHFSEGHLLHVGVFNLGFCAVDRRAEEFLAWWWGHLRSECLHDPIAGLFVDQKWVDLGAVLFDAASLRHYGYNVSVANLHERPLVRDGDGYRIATSDEPLRLFHFHAFDPDRPNELSTRFEAGAADLRAGSDALDTLCKEYAEVLIEKARQIGRQPDYIYDSDTTGRRITRRMRHAFRVAAQHADGNVASPFVADEAAEYAKWRRSAWPLVARLMLSDVAKGLRCALPEEYENVKRRVPGLTKTLRGRYLERSGMWENG
jgi:hypothetical protein